MTSQLRGKANQRQRKKEAPARQQQKRVEAAERARWCTVCAAFGKATPADEGAYGMCQQCFADDCRDMGGLGFDEDGNELCPCPQCGGTAVFRDALIVCAQCMASVGPEEEEALRALKSMERQRRNAHAEP